MALPVEEIVLFIATFGAGFIDSIVGGGGLISVPALLFYGASPIEALATNKLQSVPGKISAITQYVSAGHLSRKSLSGENLGLSCCICFAAGALGAFSATRIESKFLEHIIPFGLIAIALYFAFSARAQTSRAQRARRRPWRGKTFALTFLSPVAFYDGFFGPAAGMFFVLGLTVLRAMKILAAIAYTRVLNLASNMGALLLFAFAAGFLWRAWLIMAPAQILGALVGSHIAMRVPQRPLRLLVAALALLSAGLLLLRSLP